MSDPPPAKRQRPDDDKIVRSPEVWHSDGSVVLQAGGTQFRVHWSVLSLHSSFFRDMQGLPQPLDEPRVEGCPIVELSDSAQDVQVVLKALYDPLFLAQKPLPLSAIASHIRLGRKYDMKDILRTLVERLAHENPRTLAAYDLLNQGKGYTPSWFRPYKGYYMDILTLAKENNLLSVLPCAYYRVASNHTETELFNGVKRPDGTRATLSPNDLRLCIQARSQILRTQWDIANTLGWLAHSDAPPRQVGFRMADRTDCMDYSVCRHKKSSFVHSYILKGAMMPLITVPPLMDALKLCDKCAEAGRAKTTEGRQKMWNSLPALFELPAWADLKDDV